MRALQNFKQSNGQFFHHFNSRPFARVGVIALALSLAACGKSPAIQLQNGQNGLPPIPGAPKDRAGGGNSNAGGPNGVQPQGGNRLMCVEDSSKQPYTISTAVNQNASGQAITVIEGVGRDSSSNPAQGTAVLEISGPHLGSVLGTNHARILLMGRSQKNAGAVGKRKLFVGDFSLESGVATVASLGDVQINASSLDAANSIGLAIRNYGSSSKGSYLIIPGKGGLRVLNSATLQDLGGLGLNASSTFWPTIDEDARTLSVVIGSGDQFQIAIYRLNLGASVSLASRIATSAGRFALSATSDLHGGYYWGETSGSPASSITLVHLAANGNTERGTFTPPTSGARVFPQVAVLNVNGIDEFAVAYESITGSGGVAGYDVSAGIAAVLLKNGKAMTQTFADYQDDIVGPMQTKGWQGHTMMIESLSSSYDHSMVSAQARTLNGNYAFQFDGSVMFEVSNQDCSQLDFLSLAN